MKTQDIQRGITSRHSRANGGGANIGRVTRLRSVEIPTGELRSRRRGERGTPARKQPILIWSIGLGLATVAVLGLTVSLWLLPYLNLEIDENASTSIRPEAIVRVASKFPSPGKDVALELAKRAILNRDPEKVDAFFRPGAATRQQILDFFTGLETRDGAIERYDWLSSMDVNGLLVEGVLVVFKGREKPVERLALLTPDAAGSWRVDFDAFARTVTPSWSELMENGADQAHVRVSVGRDFYFNGPFSDEKEWVCYGIASADTEQTLHGYCKVGSPEAEAMAKMFSDGEKVSRATLEIRRMKAADPRQFEITRVLGRDWILAETPANRS